MNHWYQMRRLRGAVILITIGVLALLNQWHVMRFDTSWPIILIVLGLMKIAERAAWSADIRQQQFGTGTPPTGPGFVPPAPPNPAYWSASSPSVGADQPFVQPHPPSPEDPGRDDR
ncbi:MAG: LiaI-LiaF-like domain-containing protein [Acidobacteriaceae bacterium]